MSSEIEHRIVALRKLLRDSALGECGAAAIHREFEASGVKHVPSVRTIGRVLERTGQLDGRRRQRRPAPPRGWYLPGLVKGAVDLDSFDYIEDLRIRNGPLVNVLNGISLHAHLLTSWPTLGKTAAFTVECLDHHWRRFGRPAYAQFDNDSVFVGNHRFPDSLGRVVRFCLHSGVIPVFAPPREHGLQNVVESANARWQKYVWRRDTHLDLASLRERSDLYVAAHRRRHAAAIEQVPRTPVPPNWAIDRSAPLHGQVIFIRRTDERGRIVVLKHTHVVDVHWTHRLVRVEVDLDADVLNCFALRRREPDQQPLLNRVPYHFPRKPFHE